MRGAAPTSSGLGSAVVLVLLPLPMSHPRLGTVYHAGCCTGVSLWALGTAREQVTLSPRGAHNAVRWVPSLATREMLLCVPENKT